MKRTLALFAVGAVVSVVFAMMKGASPLVAVVVSPIGAIGFIAGGVAHDRLDSFRKHGKDLPFLEYEDRDDV